MQPAPVMILKEIVLTVETLPILSVARCTLIGMDTATLPTLLLGILVGVALGSGAAWIALRTQAQIVPVAVKSRKGESTVETDEAIRADPHHFAVATGHAAPEVEQ